MDAVSIIYSSGGGKNCEECIQNNGCFWQADCCVNSGSVIVNDLTWSPLVVNQSIVVSDKCYYLVGNVLGPATDVIITTYTGCDDCVNSGAHDPCP